MQGNRIIKPANKQSGFSLVELMIAIAIGLLITAAVTAMAVNSLKMNSQTLKSARLNQDLGAVMQIMVNDIRRAGYASCVDDAGAFPPVVCNSPKKKLEYDHLEATDEDEDINIVSSTCVLYSYNRNSDDTKNDDERQGFKLENNQIKMRISCGNDDLYDEDATVCATDCSDSVGKWVNMTDPEVIKITEFEINSENSKCHNIDIIDEGLSIRIKSDSSSIKFACNQDDPSKVQKWAVDSNGDWDWDALSAIPGSTLSSSGTSIGIRHVNISLEAELTRDSSVSKNLDVSIRVRNDHVYLN